MPTIKDVHAVEGLKPRTEIATQSNCLKYGSSLPRKNEKDLQKGLVDIVARNAKKLKQLTDGVLDVTRIETKSFQLNKEEFYLYDLIMYLILDHRNQIILE